MIPVLYSAATGRVREFATDPARTTEADWAGYLRGKVNAAVNVVFLENADLEQIQALVSKATGLTPKDDRYVIVENNVITGWIGNADPACGDFESLKAGAELIPSDKATEKWTVDPQTKELIPPVEAPVVKAR